MSDKLVVDLRAILYKIFITNITGDTIIKELLNQFMESNLNNKIKSNIVDIISRFQYRLSKGKRCIIHIEACIYNIMDMINYYK